MNDLYWMTVLKQEGIEDDLRHREAFDKFSACASTILVEDAAGKITEPKQDKVILEPSIRLQALKRIGKQLTAFTADAEAKSAQISGLAEQIETTAYKKSCNLDDYYQNITVLVDAVLFDGALNSHKSPVTRRERAEVINTLRSFQTPFKKLIDEVGGRLQELQGSRQSWTREEKELPNIYNQMTAVHQLLVSSLNAGESDIVGVNTEMLTSIEKQIDYWLSLGKRFPIPMAKNGKTPSSEPRKPRCLSGRNGIASVKAYSSTLPSLFYHPLHPSPALPRFGDQRAPFNGLQLPPFNPQKSLPPKCSQPLLASSTENALGAGGIFSSPKRVSSSSRRATSCSMPRFASESSLDKAAEEDFEMKVISNLTSLQKPGRESEPGSTEVSPRTSSSQPGKGKSPRGRKPRNLGFGDELTKSENEHAFILSKLAEVMGKQRQAFDFPSEPPCLTSRRGKRVHCEKPEGKDIDEDINPRPLKTKRSCYKFEMQLRNTDSRKVGC